MHLREVITSSKNALQSNPLRTALTMLGIIIGITSVILISSIGQGAVLFITDQLSVLGTNIFRVAPGNSVFETFTSTSDPLTTDDAQAIKDASIPNVDSVVPVAVTTRNISTQTQTESARVYGMTHDAQAILKPELVYGEFISEINVTGADQVAVIGINIAQDFFGQDTNPVGESIRIDDTRYRIIGVTSSVGGITDQFNNGVNIPINTLISDVTGEDRLFQIVVRVVNDGQLDQTIIDVEDFLHDYRGFEPGEENDFFTQAFKDVLGTVRTVITLLTAMVTAISAISLLVGGVGVMNIMLVTVTERTREIGLLKAIGAREQDILTQFLLESITLSLVGGTVGIIIGTIAAFTISQVVDIPFVISPVMVLLAVALSTSVGIIFGVYPARRAAKLHPIDALRFE